MERMSMQPLYVQHRVNTVAELARADVGGGVEIDVRSRVDQAQGLHLSHDPWVLGEDLEVWLAAYARRGFQGPLVLNTKEDGLEDRILRCLEAARIDNFFFLDTAPPTLVRLLKAGHGANTSVRLSAWEPAQAAEPWLMANTPAHRPGWVWLDCFEGDALPESAIAPWVHAHPEVKVCLVSPELQRAPLERIAEFHGLWRLAAAVCTKRPDVWQHTMKKDG